MSSPAQDTPSVMPKQNVKPTNKSLLDEIVEIKVGPSNTMFKIHKGLLCDRASYFRAVYQNPGDWKEKSEGLTLETVDPRHFPALHTMALLQQRPRQFRVRAIGARSRTDKLLFLRRPAQYPSNAKPCHRYHPREGQNNKDHLRQAPALDLGEHPRRLSATETPRRFAGNDRHRYSGDAADG
ncbi:hypothetical protein XPA_009467 [Xanthoria parietina]